MLGAGDRGLRFCEHPTEVRGGGRGGQRGSRILTGVLLFSTSLFPMLRKPRDPYRKGKPHV